MDPLLMRELILVRDACKEVEFARSQDDIKKIVRQLQEYISKIIVDHSAVPVLERDCFRQVTKNYNASTTQLVAEVCRQGLGGDTINALARELVAADYRFWQNYVGAAELEIGKISGTEEKQTVADPTAIDRKALAKFIRRAIPGEDQVDITDVRTASIGNSKATLLVSLSGNRILPNDIVIRKDQAFNFLGTHVVDEYPALQLLYRHGVPVPQPYAIEPSGDVLGHPFLLCSKVEGSPVGTIYFAPPRDDKMLASLARALAKIHTVPVEDLDFIGVKGPQRQDYIQAEIEKYSNDWKDLNAESTIIDLAFAWVRANIEDAHGRFSIVHNDYSYHNILINDSEVTAVLDWEFIHIGNPAADLSYFRDDTEQGAGFDFFLEEYTRAGGGVPSQKELDFYYIWGHTRFAVMNMQTKIGLQRGNMKGLRPMMPTLHYMPKPMLALGEKLEHLLS
jgi:aminoglycoside phosphotransferase (APT) family kinase protein